MRISLLVAVAENGVIGQGGRLPWHLPADLRRFRELTTGHAVVLGRRTQESIVARLGHPLPGRVSVVVTSRPQPDEEAVRHRPSVPAALAEAVEIEQAAGGDEVFVIGGTAVYLAALSEVEHIYLTRVHAAPAGDARLPDGWLAGFVLASSTGPQPARDGEPAFSYEEYRRP